MRTSAVGMLYNRVACWRTCTYIYFYMNSQVNTVQHVLIQRKNNYTKNIILCNVAAICRFSQVSWICSNNNGNPIIFCSEFWSFFIVWNVWMIMITYVQHVSSQRCPWHRVIFSAWFDNEQFDISEWSALHRPWLFCFLQLIFQVCAIWLRLAQTQIKSSS